jgi:hypothetical protein
LPTRRWFWPDGKPDDCDTNSISIFEIVASLDDCDTTGARAFTPLQFRFSKSVLVSQPVELRRSKRRKRRAPLLWLAALLDINPWRIDSGSASLFH